MSCGTNPPAPAGYRVWRKTVPPPLTQWAIDIRDHINKFPYGTTWTSSYAGQQVLARKDFHDWTYRKQPDGTVSLVTGICLAGVTLFEPIPIGGTASVTDSDLTTPDPNAAVFSIDEPPRTTNWSLVTVSAGSILAVSLAFAYAIRKAGRARG